MRHKVKRQLVQLTDSFKYYVIGVFGDTKGKAIVFRPVVRRRRRRGGGCAVGQRRRGCGLEGWRWGTARHCFRPDTKHTQPSG